MARYTYALQPALDAVRRRERELEQALRRAREALEAVAERRRALERHERAQHDAFRAACRLRDEADLDESNRSAHEGSARSYESGVSLAFVTAAFPGAPS